MKFKGLAVRINNLIIAEKAVYGFSVHPIRPLGQVTISITMEALGERKFAELLVICNECSRGNQELRGYFTGELTVCHIPGSWDALEYRYELHVSDIGEVFMT